MLQKHLFPVCFWSVFLAVPQSSPAPRPSGPGHGLFPGAAAAPDRCCMENGRKITVFDAFVLGNLIGT